MKVAVLACVVLSLVIHASALPKQPKIVAVDTPESLRQLIGTLLTAAQGHNEKRFAKLIRQTEMPLPKQWNSSENDTPQAGSVSFYRLELKRIELAFQLLLQDLAQNDGDFVIKKENENVAPEDHLDWEILKMLNATGDVYSVVWKPRGTADSSKGEAVAYLVGFFTFIPGESRWAMLGPPRLSTHKFYSTHFMKTCQGEAPQQPCSASPRAIYAPDPEFSEAARKIKFAGDVTLELTVDVDGHVHDIMVTRFTGYDLDKQAVRAVNQWKFEPALYDGSPVPSRIAVEVGFRLY